MKFVRRLLRVLGVLVLIHIAALTFLYFFQEKLIFHAPPKLAADYKFNYAASFEEINIPSTGDITLNGLLFKTEKPSKGLIFYLHGNGGSLEGWGYMSDVYTKLGYDLFILDYRSYGKSGGEITDKDEFLEDIRTAYRYMMKSYPEDKIVVTGFSIGTGPAAWLAGKEHPKTLILQAPYYDLASIATKRFPMVPMSLLRYNFTTSEYLKSVDCPIYMFHGTEDKVVPYENSIQIMAENPKIKFFTIKGLGHAKFNDDVEFQRELASILN
ncbi:MAG: alpha/beta hydrolase [Flavobacterium sp.]|uniref:alpha/beta hydrolase n=1 Tax=Flavobacterium sp. TaxID=239 RepID=UPI00121FACD6|nr:alpha/beta hydrolase [Flavobacterium sp.]RZJ67020.1 MAG: alpha/beta hydrolase [Flavobacterium sp.]